MHMQNTIPQLTCRLHLAREPELRTVTISGDQYDVLKVVGKLVGYEVEIRLNPQSDDGMPLLVVDRSQAEGYCAFDAEVIPGPLRVG